jgi:hypothetical protein
MEENATQLLKKCPCCAEDIPIDAATCPHCGTQFVDCPTQEQYQAMYVPQNSNAGAGLAIASFVLGILGLMCGCCCCIWPIAPVLAIIFGLISRNQAKAAGTDRNSWMSITGLILGIVGLIFGACLTALGIVTNILEGSGRNFHHFNFNMP